MSWLGRDNPLRSSFGRRKSYRFTPFQKVSEGTCFEVFKSHWQQVWSIMVKYEGGYDSNLPLADDVNSIINLLDQMTILLLQEVQPNDNSGSVAVGPILSYFLSEGCLEKLFTWSTYTGEFIDVLKQEQLKLFELLVSNCHQDLLFHKPIVRPLLRLLSSCRECCPLEVEKRLVVLLNTLCVCITQFPDLLQVFFHASSDHGAKRSDSSTEMFLIFSLLIPFVHREGAIGQQARDALLLCMSLSRKNESIGAYIAEHSNFCPILATGLSGLYSVLPRKLSISSEDWHCFTNEDISSMSELSMFLNSLEFCNAVIQVAHPMVQEQLLEYLYQGFLIPVLGPALHQNTLEEIIATTAYVELFLRTVTEPILLQVFLKFLLTSSHDGHFILNTLIDRLGSQGRLCLVTMSLFHRLLDMNCEDVIFQLVLRFLIPCSHIMVSQRSRIKDVDIYSSSADKFLSLIPNCCSITDPVESTHTPQSVPSLSHFFIDRQISTRSGSLSLRSHNRSPVYSFSSGDFERKKLPPNDLHPEVLHSSYLDYLRYMHDFVRQCTIACQSWSAPYDGCDPPPPGYHGNKRLSTSSKSEFVHNGCAQITCDRGPEIIEEDQGHVTSYQRPAASSKPPLDKCQESSQISSKVDAPTTVDLVKVNDGVKNDCNRDILNQLIAAEDESTFWSIINSTKTPSSVSDLDDSLETVDVCLKEFDLLRTCDKAVVDLPCPKECGSNLDSGVFESRDSNSSSDRDNDSDFAAVSCAKTKTPYLDSSSWKASSSKPSSTWETFNPTPSVGPFLGILLTRLEMMMQNDVYTNLHLTGLISRLACYPQPLLRSFLLNPSLVFQPTVRSLLQVLGSLKHKVDSYSCTVDNFGELVTKSKSFLLAREECFLQKSQDISMDRAHHGRQDRTSQLQRGEPRRRSFTNMLFRRSSFFRGKTQSLSKDIGLESIYDNQNYRFVVRPTLDALEGEMESVKTKNAVLCAVVLEEFLKEIAAITQEHSIIQLDPDFWDSRWQLVL